MMLMMVIQAMGISDYIEISFASLAIDLLRCSISVPDNTGSGFANTASYSC